MLFTLYKSKAFNGITLPNNSSGLSKETSKQQNLRVGVPLLYLDLSSLVLPEVLYGIWRYSDMHGMMLVWFAKVAGKQETMSHIGSHLKKSSLSLLFNLLELWRFTGMFIGQSFASFYISKTIPTFQSGEVNATPLLYFFFGLTPPPYTQFRASRASG